MDKQEYYRILRLYLGPLSYAEIDHITDDLDKLFEEEQMLGKSESEIIKNLGDPREKAKQYLPRQEARNSVANPLLAILLLIVLSGPILAIFGVLFAFLVSALAMIIAAISFVIGFPAFFISIPFYIPNPVLFGIGITLIGVGILWLSVIGFKFFMTLIATLYRTLIERKKS